MLIKTLHLICVVLSITGFIYRVFLKLHHPEQLKQKWLKILPHIIDTLLLASAIYLIFDLQFYPTEQPWLLAKIILLFVYILLGFITLRFGRSQKMILISAIFAIGTFAMMVAIALTKQVWPLPMLLS